VPQFQVCELPVPGVGGEGGEPVPVDVSEPQLRARVRALLRTIIRIPAGQEDMSRMPVMSATHAPSRTSLSPS
jgi:hypothetical protein